MTDNINPRAVALDIVIEVMEKQKLSHVVIKDKLDKLMSLDRQKRGFIVRIAQGTIEKCIELDYIIDTFSKVKVKKMKPVIRNIMRISVYQAKYMDSVPQSAICNEAVKLAAKRGFSSLKGFVNAVLRSYFREPSKVVYPDKNKDFVRYMSIVYSVPEWIINMWSEEYGREKTESMIIASQKESSVTVRMNSSKVTEEQLFSEFEEDGIIYERIEEVNGAFCISGYDTVDKISAFRKGYIQVQDVSSMLVGIVADPHKNNVCIDVCAAPGGKTIHIADMLNGTGSVIARDISEGKVNRIRENIERCGFNNVECQVWDATVTEKSLYEGADIVIADLPCSGLGVIGRKNDIKYKTTMQDIENLAKIQRDILNVVSSYVKPGGTLIFSTCTVNTIENNENVKWILENLPFDAESFEKFIPEKMYHETAKKGYIQYFNGENDMDGFFISRFKKRMTDE